MKVTLILGSRNPQGQTAQAADALATGLESRDAQVERFFLPSMRVERCRQCDASGWGLCRAEGCCVIEDDLGRLLTALDGADLAVFATPVYFGSLSESLRALLDHLRRLSVHPAGKAHFASRRAAGVCVAGGGGGGAYLCSEELDRILRTMGFDVLDVVPVRRQNLPGKCEVLRRMGEQLVDGSVQGSPHTSAGGKKAEERKG